MRSFDWPIGIMSHHSHPYALWFMSKLVNDFLSKKHCVDQLKSLFIKERIQLVNKELYEKEIFWFECNPADCEYYVKAHKKLSGRKVKNSANSIIAFLIGLTDSNPTDSIKKTKGSLPDVDFDTTARDKIKSFLVKKYGADRVCLIGTKGTLKLKSAIKAAFRAEYGDAEFSFVNDLTQKIASWERALMPEDPADAFSETELLEECCKLDPDIDQAFKKYPNIKSEVEKLIGQVVSSGVHAGGICISNDPIYEVCPVTWSEDHKMYVTQPEMAWVEYCGLIKYDFLGLKTLEQIRDCRRLIKKRHGISINKNQIDLHDKMVYQRFIPPYVQNEGVFQFKTDTARSILSKISERSSFSSPFDAAIVTAAGRPGPMKSGLVDLLLGVMNGESEPKYPVEEIKEILSETYGQLIYQEQIMLITQRLGKFDDAEAAKFIKAVSKKIPEEMKKFEDKFFSGVREQKINEANARKVWDIILKFGEYGFNKAHSVSYAVTGYICQWLKEYYPLEFISSVLSHCKDEEFKKYYPAWSHIIRPPSVSLSETSNYCISGNKIMMDICAIRNVGESVANFIVSNRPYRNSVEFFEKCSSGVNKRAMKNLIFAGALDEFAPGLVDKYDHRKMMFEEYVCITHGVPPLTEEDRESGIGIIEKRGRSNKALDKDMSLLNECKSKKRINLLLEELELMKISTMDYHSFLSPSFGMIEKKMGAKIKTFIELGDAPVGAEVVVIGSIKEVKLFKVAKKDSKIFGQDMAIISIDQRGIGLSITVFPSKLAMDKQNGNIIPQLKCPYPVIIKGKVGLYRGETTLEFSSISVPGMSDIKSHELSKSNVSSKSEDHL